MILFIYFLAQNVLIFFPRQRKIVNTETKGFARILLLMIRLEETFTPIKHFFSHCSVINVNQGILAINKL